MSSRLGAPIEEPMLRVILQIDVSNVTGRGESQSRDTNIVETKEHVVHISDGEVQDTYSASYFVFIDHP